MGLSTNLWLAGLTLWWFWHFRCGWMLWTNAWENFGFKRSTMVLERQQQLWPSHFFSGFNSGMRAFQPVIRIDQAMMTTSDARSSTRLPVSQKSSVPNSESLAAQSWVIGVIGVKVMSVTIGRWSDTKPREIIDGPKGHRVDFHCLVLKGRCQISFHIFPWYHAVSKFATRVNGMNVDQWLLMLAKEDVVGFFQRFLKRCSRYDVF